MMTEEKMMTEKTTGEKMTAAAKRKWLNSAEWIGDGVDGGIGAKRVLVSPTSAKPRHSAWLCAKCGAGALYGFDEVGRRDAEAAAVRHQC
jgi:hypothetical protein